MNNPERKSIVMWVIMFKQTASTTDEELESLGLSDHLRPMWQLEIHSWDLHNILHANLRLLLDFRSFSETNSSWRPSLSNVTSIFEGTHVELFLKTFLKTQLFYIYTGLKSIPENCITGLWFEENEVTVTVNSDRYVNMLGDFFSNELMNWA